MRGAFSHIFNSVMAKIFVTVQGYGWPPNLDVWFVATRNKYYMIPLHEKRAVSFVVPLRIYIQIQANAKANWYLLKTF